MDSGFQHAWYTAALARAYGSSTITTAASPPTWVRSLPGFGSFNAKMKKAGGKLAIADSLFILLVVDFFVAYVGAAFNKIVTFWRGKVRCGAT